MLKFNASIKQFQPKKLVSGDLTNGIVKGGI
jgi:hypothetical protein